jgi:predicted RNase H-like HicB family nuclease
MLEYHAAYYPIEDGWYLARILDFPGVITQGRNLKAARKMLRSALVDMAVWCVEDREPLPLPNPRARDRKAELQETIRLELKVTLGEAG